MSDDATRRHIDHLGPLRDPTPHETAAIRRLLAGQPDEAHLLEMILKEPT